MMKIISFDIYGFIIVALPMIVHLHIFGIKLMSSVTKPYQFELVAIMYLVMIILFCPFYLLNILRGIKEQLFSVIFVPLISSFTVFLTFMIYSGVVRGGFYFSKLGSYILVALILPYVGGYIWLISLLMSLLIVAKAIYCRIFCNKENDV